MKKKEKNVAYGQQSTLSYAYDIQSKMVHRVNVKKQFKIVKKSFKNVQNFENVRHGAKKVCHSAKNVRQWQY